MSYPVGGKTVEQWAREIGLKIGEGKKPVTAYRWIADGYLHPVNINGRFYVTATEDHRFWTMAAAGEFALVTESVASKVEKARNGN